MKRIFSSLLTLLILITFSVASDTDRGKDIKQLNIGKPCCSNCDEKRWRSLINLHVLTVPNLKALL